MEKLIVVLGPTAVGKTRLSIDLARWCGGEVISGDSMLIYRGLDIGAAKPDLTERQGVVHHLVDILETTDDFSVTDFQKLAGEAISALNQAGKIPVLAGGTGLYLRALLEGYQFNTAAGDEKLRQRLTALAEEKGRQYLHDLLRERVPQAAERLHPNDLRRVIRALEVHELCGEEVSRDKAFPRQLLYDAAVIGLTMDRAVLYPRINQRVELMLEQGLVEEVQGLLARGMTRNCQAMQGIGYKEIAAYLYGETDLNTAAEKIKQVTRHFAKRQFTWYRQMPYVKWFDVEKYPDYDKMREAVCCQVAEILNLR
ncbi:MAG TPA: tRNA (adenosine(37)-N6)-dimethylallyltransferase MiaA [Patescibacteria group bacterium]|nr:tRNA (adenosine(37)-N6)-dimethylallyltransferase MiaA [Patescibacteria group bacterium]